MEERVVRTATPAPAPAPAEQQRPTRTVRRTSARRDGVPATAPIADIRRLLDQRPGNAPFVDAMAVGAAPAGRIGPLAGAATLARAPHEDDDGSFVDPPTATLRRTVRRSGTPALHRRPLAAVPDGSVPDCRIRRAMPPRHAASAGQAGAAAPLDRAGPPRPVARAQRARRTSSAQGPHQVRRDARRRLRCGGRRVSTLGAGVRAYLASEGVPIADDIDDEDGEGDGSDDDGDDRLSFPVDVLPVGWRVHVWIRVAEHQVLVHSVYPALVPEDRRAAVGRFLHRANFGAILGNFELDLDDGEVRYRTSIEVGDLHPSPGLLRPLFVANIGTCHRYFPGLAAVIGGASVEGQIELIEG